SRTFVRSLAALMPGVNRNIPWSSPPPCKLQRLFKLLSSESRKKCKLRLVPMKRPIKSRFQTLAGGPVQKHVAQVSNGSNLLFRRVSSWRAQENIQRFGDAHVLPIGNGRYSRLEPCATIAALVCLPGCKGKPHADPPAPPLVEVAAVTQADVP